MSDASIAALVATAVSLGGVILSGIVTFVVNERQAKHQYKTEFAAERVARELLEVDRWNWRSFEVLKQHLGGFEDNDLRRILVRAGAIRAVTKNGTEMWGLLSKVRKSVMADKTNKRGSLTLAPVGEPERSH